MGFTISRTSTDAVHASIAAASPGGAWSGTRPEVDERRFATVVLPYLGDAYGLARWLTSNHADSEDVVQDACLRALHGIDNFGGGDARSWVLTIVRRTAYDWLNRNRPAAIVQVEDLEDAERARLPEPDAGTSESRLIDWEEETLLKNAIAALPAHYREALVLRHVQGLSYREIADLTGISIGTVMSRLSRARGHLSRRLKRTRSARAEAPRRLRVRSSAQLLEQCREFRLLR
jgi:RNA polymerase sigma factor (sigma-70 family)